MGHDPLFKELFRTFFAEFIDLFFPRLAAYLDAGSIEFVEKEFFTDLGSGQQHTADLLVKARFRNQEAYFLIHIEAQSSHEPGFPFRMFQYAMLPHIKTGLPVYPIALFSFDAPRRAEPNEYKIQFPDFTPLRFEFKSIQLNRLSWRKFIKQPNPVAAALMTRMRIAKPDRPRVKLEILRMIATLKLDKARAALIGMFMESYLKLTKAENAVYNRELEKLGLLEQEAVMQYTNPWIEEGKELGREQGRQEGQKTLIVRQLRRRFGQLPVELLARITSLSDTQLDEFGEAILDFRALADVDVWIAARAS